MSQRFLHIHSGDYAADVARMAISGTHISYFEQFFTGPMRGIPGSDEWYEARSRAIPNTGYTQEQIGRKLRLLDAVLEDEAAKADSIYLWFDNCLYDQMILSFLVATKDCLKHRELQLIYCPDTAPGHVRICGFGEFSVDELPAVFEKRNVLTNVQRKKLEEAWQAFSSANPHDWLSFAMAEASVMPNLNKGGMRLVEELPNSATGLSRLEAATLTTVLDGTSNFTEIFKNVSALEEYPYFGDLYYLDLIRNLASGPVPLLTVRGDVITATLQGMRTLWGWGNWRQLNPVTKYLGNVKLAPESRWAWDKWQKSIVTI